MRRTAQVVAQAERVEPAGFFVASWSRTRRRRYSSIALRNARGWARELDDVYRFRPVLGDLEACTCSPRRSHLESHQKLGSHCVVHEGVSGASRSAVWAPNARRVSIVGDFNAWDGRRMPMRRRHAGGVWEIFVPGLQAGHCYKYEIVGATGELLPLLLKADSACRTGGAAAGHRLDRRLAVAARVAGRGVDERALGAQRPRGADLDL